MASPPLSQGVGYGIVIGLGFVFAFGKNIQHLSHPARFTVANHKQA